LSHRFVQFVLVSCCLGLVGCQKAPPPEFRLNAVELLKQERLFLDMDEQFDESYQVQIGTILTSLFGTPDDPRFPALLGAEDPVLEILDIENLSLAAGPVNSDKDGTPSGLYREHCAHCHGISGDGAGPTAAFLNPYPRDFRLSKFKFKSTPLRQPPTDHDLETILRNGIPGTAMPSFRTLSDNEFAALIDYVKYLTIRGQFERYLLAEVNGLDGAPLIDLELVRPDEDGTQPTDKDRAAFEEQAYALIGDGLLEEIVYRWLEPEKRISKVPPAPPNTSPDHEAHQELVETGRQLFYAKGNCLQCHGDTGMGDGQTTNFDDWTNDWIKTTGVDPYEPATFGEFLAAGALPPRPIRPRNLHLPVMRGGNHPNDVYLRIANGIEGTPMPSSAALTPAEIWALVAYVKALPYEPTAAAKSHKKVNETNIAK
jgi:mono/diheme cytochrome c family protein